MKGEDVNLIASGGREPEWKNIKNTKLLIYILSLDATFQGIGDLIP